MRIVFNIISICILLSFEIAGTTQLYLGKKSGWHSLIEGVGVSSKTIDVKTVALDDIGDGELNPDLIKIDVEGVEHRVLDGAKATVGRCRPTFVIDLHPHLGADIDRVEDFFRSRDYHAFALHDLGARLVRPPETRPHYQQSDALGVAFWPN